MDLEKEKKVQEIRAVDPSQAIQTKLAKATLGASILIALLLVSLRRQQSANEDDVRNSSMFIALVISTMFSFAGAFGVLWIGNRPRLANLRRCYFLLAMVSIASASSILAFESVKLVSVGIELCKDENWSLFINKYVSQVFEKICPACEEPSEVT